MVIGLMSYVPGVGKDTLAAYLIQSYGFTRVAYAEALYLEVANAFGVSVEFLEHRETKETPLEALCLANCCDLGFVAQMLALYPGEPIADLAAPRSPRWVLQNWGTEYRRRLFSETYWLDRVDAKIAAAGGRDIVITDVRFPNEIEHVLSLGGSLVRVRRVELEEQMKDSPAVKHDSQTKIKSYSADLEVFNTEGHPEEMFESLRRSLLLKAS
jgi:hypothetical protein